MECKNVYAVILIWTDFHNGSANPDWLQTATAYFNVENDILIFMIFLLISIQSNRIHYHSKMLPQQTPA